MAEKPQARKYSFKNLLKDRMVHVKELRKALSPGKEVEWEGLLNPNTPRLVDQGILEVKDLGPGDVDKEKGRVADSRAKMSGQVQIALAKQRRRMAGGRVEAVKASDLDAPPPAPIPEPTPAPEPPPVLEPAPEPEPEPGRLDLLMDSEKKKSKKK